jgi:hypothetical protein
MCSVLIVFLLLALLFMWKGSIVVEMSLLVLGTIGFAIVLFRSFNIEPQADYSYHGDYPGNNYK